MAFKDKCCCYSFTSINEFLSDEFYVTGPLQILVEKKKKTPKRDSVSVSKLVDF